MKECILQNVFKWFEASQYEPFNDVLLGKVPEEEINSQSLEDTQVGYILEKYTLEWAFKHSYTFSSI